MAAIALMALLGWRLDLPLLTAWAPDAATMKPLTALCFLALVLALRAADAKRGKLSTWFAWCVAVVAILSLAKNVATLDLGINAGLAVLFGAGSPGPGDGSWRMASPTAIMFIAAAIAIGLGERGFSWLRPALAGFVCLVAFGELVTTVIAGRQAHLGEPLFALVPLSTMTAFLILAGEQLRRWPVDVTGLMRRSRPSIALWLLALVLAAVAPVLTFAGIAAHRLASSERLAMTHELEQRAEAAGFTVERYLNSARNLAVTLAAYPEAQAQDLSVFHAIAQRVVAAGKLGGAVLLIDPSGQQLVNTLRPFGSPLPAFGDPQSLAMSVEKKSPLISDLFQGALTGARRVAALAPVIRDGQVISVVVVSIDPMEISAMFQEQRLPEGWIGNVHDRGGFFVARTRAAEIFTGVEALPEAKAVHAKSSRGGYTLVNREGIPVTAHFVTLAESGWRVIVGVPTEQLEAPATASLRFMLGLGLVSLIFASGLAFVVGRYMHREVTRLRSAALAVGEGREPRSGNMAVGEFAVVGEALASAHSLIDSRAAALQGSEARLRLFVEHAPAAIAMFDRDMRYIAVSHRWSEAYGLTRSPLGRSHYEVFPDLSASWKATHRRCLAGAMERGDGDPFRLPDGSVRFLKWEVRPWNDANGAIGGLLISSEDVTDQLRRERNNKCLVALQQAVGPAASTADIMRAASDVMSREFDLAHFTFTEIDVENDQVTVIYDHHAANLAPLTGQYRLRDYLTEDERRTLSAGETIVIDDVRREPRHNDKARQFEALGMRSLINASYVRNGVWKFMLHASRGEPTRWTTEDAELLSAMAARIYVRLERARAEEALRRAHDSFRHLVEHSPFGIYVVDADFRLAQVSTGAQKVFANVRPLIGRDFAEVMHFLWPEDFAAEAIGHFRRTLATGEPYRASSSVERRHDSGELESYDWKIERVTLPDGRFGVVCHFYDLSERERYERALAESEAWSRTVFEANPDCVKILTLDGRVEGMNRNGQNAMDVEDFDQLRGGVWVDAWPPEARDALRASIADALAGKVGCYSGFCPTLKGTPKWWDVLITAAPGPDGTPVRLIASSRDITARKRAEEQADLLLKEVNHRAKNLLAVVQAVARQTARRTDPDHFVERFTERLGGLAASQDLLVRGEWKGVDLGDLVRSQLVHLEDYGGTRIVLDGPALQITPAAAQALGMAIHELATNAVKYGALSNAAGSVLILWKLLADADGKRRFNLQWSEHGGPPCAPPKRTGFGHTVIVAMVQHGLEAEVSLSYPRSGLEWHLSAPAGRVLAANFREAAPVAHNLREPV